MKPLVRWTVGDVNKSGYECLKNSIEKFTQLYDVESVVCFNGNRNNLPTISGRFFLIDQQNYKESCPLPPVGVAWKLYPPRLDPTRHELVIDNDLIVEERIEQIDQFFSEDCTLLLEDRARAYGRFEKHVPKKYQINSGLYGMPPNFDLLKFIKLYAGTEWEQNAKGIHAKNKTFDEQGIVAISLLSYHSFVIIPQTCITNCEHNFITGSGYHFIGLNRSNYHRPYNLYKCRNIKLFL